MVRLAVLNETTINDITQVLSYITEIQNETQSLIASTDTSQMLKYQAN